MKVGIVTQPLIGNYGGIFQNYALQKILRRMRHDPITIDFFWSSKLFTYLRSTIKSLILYPFPNKRRSFLPLFFKRSNPEIDKFVKEHINTTKCVYRYTPSLIDSYKIEAIITGSDQVWRPKYNPHLKNLYLDFAKDNNIPKIAYAASFGSAECEYTDKEIAACYAAAQGLTAISVREVSGIDLCRRYFGVEAKNVLDPTLLLTAEDYRELAKSVPVSNEKYIGAYILDNTPTITPILNQVYQQIGIGLIKRSTENNVDMSPLEWLAMFRDAEFIVTDSFHGTVFSIIFQKPFISLYNATRGGDRFTSLLMPLGLINRLIDNNKGNVESILSDSINWSTVKQSLDKHRQTSLDFLRTSLL